MIRFFQEESLRLLYEYLIEHHKKKTIQYCEIVWTHETISISDERDDIVYVCGVGFTLPLAHASHPSCEHCYSFSCGYANSCLNWME